MLKDSALLRAAIAVFLGVLALLAYGCYLSATITEAIVAKPGHLAQALDRADAYNRIHETGLLRQQFEDILNPLLGEFNLGDADRIELQRAILTRDYLKINAEQHLEALSRFFRFESDVLEAQLNLGDPIQRVKPVLFAFLDERMDRAGIEAASSPEDLGERMVETLTLVANGTLAVSPPRWTLGYFDPALGSAAYQTAIEAMRANPSIPKSVIANLDRREAEILGAFETEDIRQGLRVATHAAAEPGIDNAIANLREALDSGTHLDLIDRLAEEVGTREEVVRDAETARTWLHFGVGLVPWVALPLMALTTIAMSLAFTPFVPHMLRWPSLGLFMSGQVFLALGLTMAQNFQGLASFPCGEDAPTCALLMDIGGRLAQEVSPVVITPSAVLTVIGIIGMVSSFSLGRRQVQPSARGSQPLNGPEWGQDLGEPLEKPGRVEE